MNVIYFGTPDWAIPPLEGLVAKGFQVSMVVTQPDRLTGRKKVLTPCAVKSFALEKNLSVFSPYKIKDSDVFKQIKQKKPNLIIVCAYGQILPQNLLDLPSFGSFNIHFSFLPRFRGASPVQASILAGDSTTGISIQKMVMKLDAGPILSESKPIKILESDTSRSLGEKLSANSKELLLESIGQILANKKPIKQDESKATFCGLIKKEMGKINWTEETPELISRKLRAYDPWPGIYSYDSDGKRINFIEVKLCSRESQLGVIQEDFTIGCRNGSVKVKRIKPEGKTIMSGEEFLRGRPHLINTLLT
ncbi:MAG: methionyl-tRNA formyltransferase [SAR324 cluster bacterium]|nr:methionyl-tRNA formyltransferase [SAR324 cluster bacterium]